MIRGPHRRKKNQRVMNRWQSTSISGKRHPENARGEGKIFCDAFAARPARTSGNGSRGRSRCRHRFRDLSRIGRPDLLEGGSSFGFGGGSTAGGRRIFGFGGPGARGYTAPAEPHSAIRKKKTTLLVLPSPEIAPATQGDLPEGADSERETAAGSGRWRNMSHCLPLYEQCQELHGNKVLINGKRCENCFDMCTVNGYWPSQFCPLRPF